MAFADNLRTLPSVEHLQRLELYDANSDKPVAIIENKPGQQGSLAVYYYVAVQHGGITPKAAQQALELYAEHTSSAQQQRGQHPNIDRLFDVIAQHTFYGVKAVPKKNAG